MNHKMILDQIIDILKKEFQIDFSEQQMDDNLLELGIDSISFMMLCVLLEESTSCTVRDDIMIDKIYNSLTIRDLINSVNEVKDQ